MIKCIVCDLDGTLLNGTHTLGEFNAQAIKQAQAQGIEFMIATGRSWDSVVQLLRPYDLHCRCLLLNGAIIQDEQEQILQELPLDYTRVKSIIAILEHYDVNVQLYTKRGVATPHPARIRDDFKQRMMKMEQKTESEVEQMMEESGFFEFSEIIQDWDSYFAKQPVIYKMEAFFNDDEKMAQVREALSYIPNIDISDSIGKNFELTDVHAQKGLVLERLVKQCGYEKEEVAVFGDSMNDYLMIKNFPYSYVPCNANEKIKALAYKIIEDNREDGVGKQILRMLKEEAA